MTPTKLEIIISIITLISAYLIGNKNVWGQRVGLIANIVWWIYILTYKRYGLIPMEFFYSIMTIRNLIKWERESGI
jgi:nicotinamide riboside transporter PnuC